MFLETINIHHFRNYRQAHFIFSEGINVIAGPNGSGKTNLLDAIYYLCVGKSYFNGTDLNNVQNQEVFFRIEGVFDEASEKTTIAVAYRQNDNKFISHNGVRYEKLAEHTGHFPIVVIDPDDTLLVVDGSEVRRRLFDTMLSQAHREYLDTLIQYNRVLQQRNTLLKQMLNSAPNELWIESYDNQLHQYGHIIHKYRAQLLQAIKEQVNRYYYEMCSGKEAIEINYESDLNEADFIHLLRGSRKKDFEWQRTTVGIHRDDFIISLNDKPLKKAGSQGQKKTAIVALKLALYQYLKEYTNKTPLLLLDDVFDKLDESRLKNLLSLVDEPEIGQVFITDTEQERVQSGLNTARKNLNYIYLA